MAISWILPVRAFQAIFAIIALGLSAHIVKEINDFNNDFDGFEHISNSKYAFNVFESVFCLLTLIYLIPVDLMAGDSALANPLISIILDGLNWVFWLAAFAAVASDLNGQTDAGEFSALLAFGVLNWLLFSVTLGWNAFSLFKGGRSSTKSTTTTTTAPSAA